MKPNKDEIIRLRAEADIKRAIQEAANKAGLSMSEYVRKAVTEYIAQ